MLQYRDITKKAFSDVVKLKWGQMTQHNATHIFHVNLGPHCPNFPKTFSYNLPTSHNLVMPKKSSYPNSWMLSLLFLSKFFFSYLCRLVQPITCAYTDHIILAPQFKNFFKPGAVHKPLTCRGQMAKLVGRHKHSLCEPALSKQNHTETVLIDSACVFTQSYTKDLWP